MLISRTIESFIEVAKKKNINKASTSLNLTASPISRRIKILEDWVGFKLFIRMQNDFVLTEKGRAFYEEILPYHEKISLLEKTYKKRKRVIHKENLLRIGTELLSHQTINKFMEHFRRNKDIDHVFYYECSKESALERLLAGDIEILLSHRTISHEHVSFLELESKQMSLMFSDNLRQAICDKSINTVFIIEQKTVDQDNFNKISTYICTSYPNADILIVNSFLPYMELIETGSAVGIVNEMFPLTNQRNGNAVILPSINQMKINVSLKTHIYFLKSNEYISKQLAGVT